MSAGFNRASDNLLAALTPTLVSGTLAADSSLAYLTDGNPARPTVFAGAGPTYGFLLRWDLGSSQPAHWLSLHHPRFDGTLTFEAHTTDDFSGAVDIATGITPIAADRDGFFPDLFLNRAALANKRYVALRLVGNTVVPALGQAWLGAAMRTFPAVGDLQHDIERAQGGQTIQHRTGMHAALSYSQGTRTSRISGRVLTDAANGLPELEAWGQDARWRARPFPLVLDAAGTRAHYVRFDQDEIVAKSNGSLVSVDLAFEVVSRGLPHA